MSSSNLQAKPPTPHRIFKSCIDKTERFHASLRRNYYFFTEPDPKKILSRYNYFAYQHGVAGNDFTKLPDGQVFIGKVCPGESAFPDSPGTACASGGARSSKDCWPTG